MSGRETLIGVGLAAVLVVGIIDAAAGHDDSSKSTLQPSDRGVVPTTTKTAPTTEPTTVTTPSPMKSKHRSHPGGSTTAVTPVSTATGQPAPTNSAEPTGAARPSKSPDPAAVLGRFRYATTGGESTNIPGTSRQFPKTTTITNKRDSCGISSTWRPIPQHVQKQVLCPSEHGVKVKSYATTISFYGVSSGQDFKCSGPSYIYRNDVAAGDTWSFTCKSADAVAVQNSRAVGFDTMNVGGTPVRTLHIHVETKLKGGNSGTSVQDYWIGTEQPVLVKETGKITATQQNVHYTSNYSLALKSLSPKT
jgi:hypothetical protein